MLNPFEEDLGQYSGANGNPGHSARGESAPPNAQVGGESAPPNARRVGGLGGRGPRAASVASARVEAPPCRGECHPPGGGGGGGIGPCPDGGAPGEAPGDAAARFGSPCWSLAETGPSLLQTERRCQGRHLGAWQKLRQAGSGDGWVGNAAMLGPGRERAPRLLQTRGDAIAAILESGKDCCRPEVEWVGGEMPWAAMLDTGRDRAPGLLQASNVQGALGPFPP